MHSGLVAVVSAATSVAMVSVLPQDSARVPQRASGDFVIANVRVFDGARTVERASVVVRGGTIRSVGTGSAPAQLLVVNGGGATVLPGLIDAHVHVTTAEDLRQAIRFGVTTVLDMGAEIEPSSLFALRAKANDASDTADLRTSGFFAEAPRGNAPPDPRISVKIPPVQSVKDAQDFVTARHREGADYLKVVLHGVRTAQSGMPNLDQSRVEALVSAAHANGLRAVAHVENLDDVEIAVAARIDGLMHIWRDGGPSPELARRLAERRTFVVPTLAVPDGLLENGGRAALLEDSRLRPLLTKDITDRLTGPLASVVPPGDALRAAFAGEVAAVKGLHDVGVTLVAGSDAGPPLALGSPVLHGISLHRELELLVACGLTPSEALAAGTANAARVFRLQDRGRIVPGMRADLLLVRGDPTRDILVTRDVLRVWKAGVEVGRTVER